MKKIFSSIVASGILFSNLNAEVPAAFNLMQLDWAYFGDSLVWETGVCVCNLNEGAVAGAATTTKSGWQVSMAEPIGLMESSITPWCFQSLGTSDGLCLDDSVSVAKGATRDGGDGSNGFAHEHFIIFPVFSVLNFVQEFMCFERASLMSLGLLSELWPQNDIIATFLKPQVLLTANPIAQSLCAVDCIKSIAGDPINHLTWCNGCMGALNTDTKFNRSQNPLAESVTNGVELTSQGHRSLLFTKTTNSSFAEQTNDTGVMKDSMCRETIFLETIKTQYMYQLAYPTVGDAFKASTHPVVLDFKNKLTNKDNAVYWLWRKRDFCAGAYLCRSTFQFSQ